MTSQPPHAVYGHSLVVISDTQFMCIGGAFGYWKYLRDVYAYNTERETWTKEANLPYPQRGMSCIKTTLQSKCVVLCLFGEDHT